MREERFARSSQGSHETIADSATALGQNSGHLGLVSLLVGCSLSELPRVPRAFACLLTGRPGSPRPREEQVNSAFLGVRSVPPLPPQTVPVSFALEVLSSLADPLEVPSPPIEVWACCPPRSRRIDGGRRRRQTVLSHALLPLAGAIVAFPGVEPGTQQQFTTASGRCTHQHAAAAIPLRR